MAADTRRTVRMPIERRYVARLLISIGLSIGVALLCPQLVGGVPSSLVLLVKWVFVPMGSMVPVATVIYTCFGWLLFCYLFSDFFEEGISHSAVHVLPRSRSRRTWFAHRMACLLVYVVLYAVLVDGALVWLGGASTESVAVALFAGTVLLDVLTLTVIMLVTLLVATLLNPVVACPVVFGGHLLALCAFASADPSVATCAAWLLPSAQGVYALHEGAVLASEFGQPVAMMGMGYSCGYLAIGSLALLAALWARFAKRDVL